MKCPYCEKGEAKYRTDPYGEEIYNDYTKYWMCDDCAEESARAI